MKTSGRAAIGALLALLMLFTGSTTAEAATTTRTDPRGDAPAHIDMTRAVYRNGLHRVSTKIAIPDLQRRGSARLTISRYATDFAYSARVRIAEDGTLQKGFFADGNLGSQKRSCGFTASWNAAENFVSISVPQVCVRGLGGGPAYLVTRTGGASGDGGPVVKRLRKG